MFMDIKTDKRDLQVFGLIWSGIFLAITFYPLIDGEKLRLWSLAISVIFISISLLKPNILKRFYIIWTKIGETIGGVISKVIMFVIYFALFTPVSILFKILGKDPLNREIDRDSSTYWIKREEQPESMKNQF
jgi:hypothetical protein